ncbi:uncharacterized protein [Ranitomeya imitator]|uniref:uncharacterized protein n=1 Tax=Ranitomeya imitator TaxID=111125 RepID=UPI0037E9961D
MLDALRKERFTINSKKCAIGKKEAKYLTNIIGKGKIKKQVNKVEAIQNGPQLVSKKQVWMFLGMVRYHLRFIPNFAMIAVPQTDLIKGMKTLIAKWSPKEELLFEA